MGRADDKSLFERIYRDEYVRHYRLVACDVERFSYSVGFDLSGVDIAGKTVMDVGCGAGLYSLYLSLVGGARRVIALDSYEGKGNPAKNKEFFLRVLKENHLEKRIKLLHADACGPIRLDGERFDVAYLSNVLHHIYETRESIKAKGPHPDHVRSLLKNLERNCAQGGVCVLNELMRHNISEVLSFARKVRIDWDAKHDPHEWAALFINYGFKLRSVDYYVPYRLSGLSSVLANKIGAYFMSGRYRIVLQKSER